MFVRNKAWAAAAALSAALGVVSATAPQASAGTVTVPYQTGYQLAYNSGNGSVMGDLCVWPNSSGVLGGCNPSTLGAAIMPGTSPAITSLHGKGYEMAYQTSAGTLAVAGKQANGDLGLAMMPGTSPSITDLSDGGYEIAFQSNTGALWVTGTAGNTAPVGVAMDPTSSPSITDAGNPGYEIAYQDASHNVEVAGGLGTENLGQNMAPGTNPSIMVLGSGYEIAYAVPGGGLVATGSLGTTAAGVAWPGTSPDITYAPPTANSPNGFYEITYQSADGRLFGYGSLLAGPVIDPRSPNGIQLAPGSSPTGAGIYQPIEGTAPAYEMFYEDPSGRLRYVIGSAFSSAYINPAQWIGTITTGTSPAVATYQPEPPIQRHH
ncbi:hypothetical protein ABH935_007752 [Catenulispora sp. GAS73]|uniref:hypothetical protein n=1 Tax=Catenulispora sp. GAS73 TaxID=3156269 RepID=UPI003517FEA1